jgi:hypothetical protein
MNLKTEINGNCTVLEETSFRVSPLGSMRQLRSQNEEEELLQEEEEETNNIPDLDALTPFVNNIVVYIAGYVAKNLSKNLKCAACLLSLVDPQNEASPSHDRILINAKNNGGLVLPSEDLCKVCKINESTIRYFENNENANLNRKEIVQATCRASIDPEIFRSLRTENSEDHPLFSNHVQVLIRSISEEYTKIRLHYIAKRITLTNNPTTNRSSCTKLIHFAGN